MLCMVSRSVEAVSQIQYNERESVWAASGAINHQWHNKETRRSEAVKIT
jgi:hypothetical protein